MFRNGYVENEYQQPTDKVTALNNNEHKLEVSRWGTISCTLTVIVRPLHNIAHINQFHNVSLPCVFQKFFAPSLSLSLSSLFKCHRLLLKASRDSIVLSN